MEVVEANVQIFCTEDMVVKPLSSMGRVSHFALQGAQALLLRARPAPPTRPANTRDAAAVPIVRQSEGPGAGLDQNRPLTSSSSCCFTV